MTFVYCVVPFATPALKGCYPCSVFVRHENIGQLWICLVSNNLLSYHGVIKHHSVAIQNFASGNPTINSWNIKNPGIMYWARYTIEYIYESPLSIADHLCLNRVTLLLVVKELLIFARSAYLDVRSVDCPNYLWPPSKVLERPYTFFCFVLIGPFNDMVLKIMPEIMAYFVQHFVTGRFSSFPSCCCIVERCSVSQQV